MTRNERQRESGPLTIVLEIPDHEGLAELFSAIEQCGVSTVTREISGSQESIEKQVHVDLGTLTRKQRRALELALEAGYYKRPREADLAALADRMDISKSAVSQRLRTAERKLIESALDPLL